MNQFAWTADRPAGRYWYNKRWHDYAGTTHEEMQGLGLAETAPSRPSRSCRRTHPEKLRKRDVRGRTRFPCAAGTAPIAGSSRALSRSAMRQATWFAGSAPTPISPSRSKPRRRCATSTRRSKHRVEAETRQRLQIWNVSQDLLVVADLEGKCLSVNPAWTATLGWSESDLLGKSSQWLLHRDDREKSRAEIGHLAAGGKTARFENRVCVTRTGRIAGYRGRRWRTRTTSMPWDGTLPNSKMPKTNCGKPGATLRRLRDARRSATMTASIAHEIKQPLGAIVANANAGLRWLNKTPPCLEEARADIQRHRRRRPQGERDDPVRSAPCSTRANTRKAGFA